jgi:hypothetical protein
MRCYFNLINGPDYIKDADGIEVQNLHEARVQAQRAIDELRDDDEMGESDWSGWRLEVTDTSGNLLFTIHLGRAIH